jgi:hypothetical protein
VKLLGRFAGAIKSKMIQKINPKNEKKMAG